MVFRVADTFKNPASGANAQRGFPAPGSGAQISGDPITGSSYVPQVPTRPIKGRRSWFDIYTGSNPQRGFPSPENEDQKRPKGLMNNIPAVGGLPLEVYTPYYSRGAAAFVENYGKTLVNPIGNGVQVNHRPQASYGGAGQYFNGAIWWTNQVIPTSIPMQGLNSPDELAAILSGLEVQGVVRTTG